MKKLILVAVIGLGAWSYYQHEFLGRSPVESDQPHQVTKPGHVERSTAAQNAPIFKCDGRQYCSQMKSRAEAEFFVRNCPNTKMDGDRDGIPCENDSRF